VLLIRSGQPSAVFNIALLLGDMDLEARLPAVRQYFADYRLPWSFWLTPDLLTPRAARRMDDACSRAGLRAVAENVGMEAEALAPPPHALPAIHVERVHDEATRETFAHIVAQSFGVQMPVAHAIYLPPGHWQGRFQAWVASDGAQPVSTAGIVHAAGAIGIYSVATLQGFRRRGYAEALMRQVIPPAGPLVLQATREGRSLYRRIGFRAVTRFYVYL
jgi:ribosomal protein S18 acetylase RimI-like enzyme